VSKILIHSIVFSPDAVSTAYLYNDIATRFKESGYIVSVLTTTPHYNVLCENLKKQPLKRKLFGIFFESSFNGIKVKHVLQKKFRNPFLRVTGFIYWHIVSFFIGLFEKDVDIILLPSPPLSIGVLGILLGKLKGAKVIYNVQEIYPDLLIAQGKIRSKRLISALKGIELYVYNKSDAVITIDEIFYNILVSRFTDRSKLRIIPNFVDTSIYRPISLIDDVAINQCLWPTSSSLKLMYAGNIGYAQDWEVFLGVAKELKKENVDFFVIGDGVLKVYLQEKIAENDLSRVHLFPYQSRETIPYLIASADMQFVFMSKQVENFGFPSKVYTIMACGKPLLVCSGRDTPIINFLENKKCAILITEDDLAKKTGQAVEVLKTIAKKELNAMGKKGFTYINLNYSKEIVTDMYINLASSLLL